MALKRSMSDAQIDKIFKSVEAQMQKDLIRILTYVGEKAVNMARTDRKYRDVTGNLTNSIGYIVVKNGRTVAQNFKEDEYGNANAKGKRNGKRVGKTFALKIAKDYPDIALIVVAGMKYAAKVESRGLDVLTSAEQYANIEVPKLLEKLAKDL